MNKIKKLTPTIIYALLLAIIAILFFISIDGSSIKISDDSLNDTDVPIVPNENLDYTSKDELIDSIIPNDTPTSPEEIKPSYNDTIPRQPLASESYLYTQKIYGDEPTILHNVLNTSKGIMAILSTSSSKGDVAGELPSIGIVCLDVAGNVQNAVSLSYSYTHTYVASQIVADGIIIISTSKQNDHLYINKVSIDLNEVSTYRIPYASEAEIIAVGTSFLIFAKYPNETIVYKPLNNSFVFQSINGGKVVEIFDYNSYFLIFCNNLSTNSYSIIKLNSNSLTLSYESSILNSQLISVSPVVENGTQSFILLSEQNGTVTATKYDYSLNNVLSSKHLGCSNISIVIPTEDKLVFFSQGNINGMVSLNYDLSTDLNQSESYNTLSKVYEVNFHKNTFFCLGLSNKNELVMIRTKNKTTTIEYFNVSTNFAMFCINNNNTLSIFLQNGNDVTILGVQQ